MLVTALAFVLILSVLVLAHESGHFFAARRFGIRVEEFGLGFPPRLWSKSMGATRYSINLIPFGGFVRLFGESGDNRDIPDSFSAKPVWQRAVVLVSGVLMNFFLAALIFIFGFTIGLPTAVDGLPQGASIRQEKLTIVQVVAGSPAAQAGLASGDSIISVNGQSPATKEALQSATSLGSVRLVINHQNEKREITVTPTPLAAGGAPRLGIEYMAVGIVSFPPHLAVAHGVQAAVNTAQQIVVSIGDFFGKLLIHRQVSADVSGPVGIAVLTGQVVTLGLPYIFQFIALLSLSLAVMNVLPIPALDGGRLLFLLVEAVRRRSVDQRVEQIVHSVGFYLLLLLIMAISIRDVQRYAVINMIRSVIKSIFT